MARMEAYWTKCIITVIEAWVTDYHRNNEIGHRRWIERMIWSEQVAVIIMHYDTWLPDCRSYPSEELMTPTHDKHSNEDGVGTWEGGDLKRHITWPQQLTRCSLALA